MKMEELSTPGLYWAREVGENKWDLVLVRKSTAPADWFEKNEPHMEIFFMAWDCGEKPRGFSEFIPANLTSPDGLLYSYR